MRQGLNTRYEEKMKLNIAFYSGIALFVIIFTAVFGTYNTKNIEIRAENEIQKV